MNGYCIMCGNKKPGIEVKSDRVISTMRWFKRNVTKNEQGHKLVVCKACYSGYKKGYDRFRSRQKLYLALGILFAIFGLLSFSLGALVMSLLFVLVMYLLSFLSYMPKLHFPAVPSKSSGKRLST